VPEKNILKDEIKLSLRREEVLVTVIVKISRKKMEFAQTRKTIRF
jgi:hypothetical protein